MFSRVSFSTVIMPIFTGDSFTLKFNMAPENWIAGFKGAL